MTDIRIVTWHDPDCDGGWVFDTRYVGAVNDIAQQSIGYHGCDKTGRRNNGGVIWWRMTCIHYFCPALALVRKGWLHEVAREAIEEATS